MTAYLDRETLPLAERLARLEAAKARRMLAGYLAWLQKPPVHANHAPRIAALEWALDQPELGEVGKAAQRCPAAQARLERHVEALAGLAAWTEYRRDLLDNANGREAAREANHIRDQLGAVRWAIERLVPPPPEGPAHLFAQLQQI